MYGLKDKIELEAKKSSMVFRKKSCFIEHWWTAASNRPLYYKTTGNNLQNNSFKEIDVM